MSAAADPPDASQAATTEDTSAVNRQVSDAVSETTASLLSALPDTAAGTLAQLVAQCTGLAMLNAVQAQQSSNMIANAAVTQTVARILLARAPTLEAASHE
jgi:killing trait domain-containing protein